MKNSLLALTTLAVLVSGCAQKNNTMNMYSSEEQIVEQFGTLLILDGRINECKDGDTIISKTVKYKTKYDVPVAFTEITNPETNETITTVAYDKLYDGQEITSRACYFDESKKAIRVVNIIKNLHVKSSEIENKDFSCSEEAEIQSAPFGVKFVTCKSK